MNNRSKEQLIAIGETCNKYSSLYGEGLSNSADMWTSCENCSHFTAEHQCDLNLMEKNDDTAREEG
ncbi:hypothetical protein [Anaeromicrobium sediminis]|uniref:Uncharacterized protein n=1 Tax=Anaeromicrobium sediminis TaxID=1478221 RepID=A0A267MKD6_9FIRM|nr:hypothetical protein [Anaeromicrobium sediminis]PAB59345.1 hypothetical protein CCE28_10815 [Anaeromicrobium sediminis]